MKPIAQRLVVILVGTFAWACPRVWGQDNGILAAKTNLLEWTAAVPNFSVMADLSGKAWNHSVAGVTLKYRWKTYETYVPSLMYDLFEVRPEYRYYWNRLYVGGYVSYANFTTLLPGKTTGWQGPAYGGGASFGYEIPLYQYKKSAIDLEIGLSAGAHYANRQEFSVSDDRTQTTLTGSPVGGILPYPELRVALVWRKTSVKDKYRQNNPMKALYKSEEEVVMINYGATSRENFDAMHQGRLKVFQNSVFLDLYYGNEETYRTAFDLYVQESFVDVTLDGIEHSKLDEKSKKKLAGKVERLKKKAMAEFDKSLKAEIQVLDQAEKNKEE